MTTIHGVELTTTAATTFGNVLTAMVTPFDQCDRVDLPAAERLAAWLTRDGWNDGIVVNGTTGESIATSDHEKSKMVGAARRAVAGSGKRVIAGVGAGDTRHSIRLAQAAEQWGADGLLLVAPYYSRPSQRGLLRHFLAVADSTSLPVMLYDIPQRAGVAIEPETFAAAAKHPSIVAVKDAKGDLESSSWVMRETALEYYSGDDALNLPLLAIGAVGFVSVVGHVVGDKLAELFHLYSQGRVDQALAVHRELLPVYRGMFRAPAAASVKAALAALGMPAGSLRTPLAELTAEEHTALLADLAGLTNAAAAGAGVSQPA
ncbi:4-hydroxy-tetrahydrodipicolinate synthase [Arthrobacter mangrovi]|uniref:4-hydroxy-tetrahydrodipicolinate synthase n=1 Tax=Arthrobacter mangrovi TaxID=2966350 RepID=A0ABQ5MW46_9MICC|nr:4-hydroxy-tetrahydrodipicolinate synthase [Arthrobacter mangrovi]GLB68183.1 4-hydroxy-tetrahydrodipicolinate synthase 2 [Arthrobacter mangrovi]